MVGVEGFFLHSINRVPTQIGGGGGCGILCTVPSFGIQNLEHEFVILVENNSLILQ